MAEATLAGSVLNLAAIREHAVDELTSTLDRIPGGKVLVFENSIPLDRVVKASTLKNRGVKSYQLLQHATPAMKPDTQTLVYIVRPNLASMKMIADHVHVYNKTSERPNFNIIFVPRKTLICEKVLENEGVLGEVTLSEFNLDLVPFDDDVLSLELEKDFRSCYLDGDRTSLYYAALSLMKMQNTFGLIPQIMGVGDAARLVADMMLHMRMELPPEEPAVLPEIDRVILMDRAVDMYTPMCMQLTYHGLIDELIGIRNGKVEIDTDTAAVGGGTTIKKLLHSGDQTFADLRDLNLLAVQSQIDIGLKDVLQAQEEFKDESKRSVREQMAKLREVSKRISPKESLEFHQLLKNRIEAAADSPEFGAQLECEQDLVSGEDPARALDYLETMINRQEDIVKVLRLLCLISLVANGLKQKVFDNLRREIVQTYGFQHMFTLQNLEKLGLVKRYDTKSMYPTLRKNLKLFSYNIDEQNPDDISYVYSGYAPLSCRLIQAAIRPGGWRNVENVVGALPGAPAFEERQVLPSGIQQEAAAAAAAAAASGAAPRPTVTLVFFLGGCTYTEISAVRFLSQMASLEGRQEDFVIATTKFINGSTLLSTVVEDLENGIIK